MKFRRLAFDESGIWRDTAAGRTVAFEGWLGPKTERRRQRCAFTLALPNEIGNLSRCGCARSFNECFEARIVPKRIEHWVEPQQSRGQWGVTSEQPLIWH